MKKTNHYLARRRQRKQSLLPQIAKLAQEGLSSRQIADKLGLSKSTIAEWMRDIKAGGIANEPVDVAKRIRQAIDYYTSLRDELTEAWRGSKAEKQVRLVEEVSASGEAGPSRKKKSIRTETQTGNANLLTQAMAAQEKIDALTERLAALEQTNSAGPGGGDTTLANLSDDDLISLRQDELVNFSDEQLYAITLRLRAIDQRNGVVFQNPIPTLDDLRNMTDPELATLESPQG